MARLKTALALEQELAQRSMRALTEERSRRMVDLDALEQAEARARQAERALEAARGRLEEALALLRSVDPHGRRARGDRARRLLGRVRRAWSRLRRA